MKFAYGFAALALLTLSSDANASETGTHTYDALGRLVQTTKSGGPASGSQTTTAYDPAGNRSNQTVTGAGGNTGSSPVISIGGASAIEGETLSFVVTRSGATTTAAGASWTTANATALAGVNYSAANGTVSFGAGETSKTVTIPTINDGVSTPDLTMSVVLSVPTGGATLDSANGLGTIIGKQIVFVVPLNGFTVMVAKQ